MSTKRKQYTPQFKFQVALEAAQNQQTISQIAANYHIHPNLVSSWRKQLLESGPDLFLSRAAARAAARQEQERLAKENALYEQIGRLKMELEWLKKKSVQFS